MISDAVAPKLARKRGRNLEKGGNVDIDEAVLFDAFGGLLIP
jgi:hypothetical protein